MRLIFGLVLGLSISTAIAGTVSRLYDFEPNTKAEADKVDAEFDNIISTINGNINSDNILDGGVATADLASNSVTNAKLNNDAVTITKMATGGSAYIKNARKGCNLLYKAQDGQAGVSQSVDISTPCELIIDGWVGSLSATATVGGLDTGSHVAKTVYYVYGSVNGSNSIDFQISASTPNTATFRKPSDSTKRYIGSLFTTATRSIARFRQNQNRYHFLDDDALSPQIDDVSGLVTSSNAPVNVAPFARAVYGTVSATLGIPGTTGTCYLEFASYSPVANLLSPNASQITELKTITLLADVLGTGRTSNDARLPLFGKRVYLFSPVCSGALPGFAGIGVSVYGWEEPLELY